MLDFFILFIVCSTLAIACEMMSIDVLLFVTADGKELPLFSEEYGMDRVLIHGQPMAINLILQGREKVIGILDWAKAHPGCFAEDVATAICWNLEPKERHCNEQRLLEFYHYNLVKYGAGNCQVTLEQVRKAYAHFLPLAMSVLILLAVNIDMSNDTKDAIVERSEMLANDILLAKRQNH
uniref:Uncharacterized protein n=1 Tax=Parascaris equorum TaxID=6256 RepID=A0A914RAN7_PAREQ